MLEALQALGFALDIDEADERVTVHGQAGLIPAERAELSLGNAGTAMRFLTAACCLGRGDFTLRGIERMHERPIGQLVEALQSLGAGIEYLQNPGYPPLRIYAAGIDGGEVYFPKAVSSQYISALLQIGPCCNHDLTLAFDAPLTSRPYVDMTIGLMHEFAGEVRESDGDEPRLTVTGGTGYQAGPFAIEPDASNAGYFLAAAALLPGARCEIAGLGAKSVQGDVWFESLLREMGVGIDLQDHAIAAWGPDRLRGIDEDLGDMPDMAQTLAVVALFAEGPSTLRGISNLRYKETDRIQALKNELEKLGARVTLAANDDMTITPPRDGVLRHPDGTTVSAEHPAVIATYDDHRMAMSFALVGLRQAGVVIDEPQCVNKTFPGFFEQLRSLGVGIEPIKRAK
jgi:3-phosphoshikimate 1-carboxyvinyltransferase